ncbi:MAG TPA: T9SS type A sorting domain-containing protein, partial [Ignavibacteria bacterium]|nr:T9SS type A sorting domain-containing protein [Ignavibacteria bacterium]
GGGFTSAGGVGANRFAEWNGSNWIPYGTGMNNDVLTIAVYTNIIYAGGDFTTASGTTVNRVTRWSMPVAIQTNGNEIPENYSLGQNYPNPFNPVTKIKFELPSDGLTSLIIYDNLGRVVEELVNKNLTVGSYEVNFDASNYSSGVYYYELTSGSYRDVKKMTLVK